MKRIITIFILHFFGGILMAQSGDDDLKNRGNVSPIQSAEIEDIKIITKSTDQGIVLRWAPTNVSTWQMGIENGYIIERITAESGKYEKVAEIRPWEESQWKPYMNDDHKYMTVSAMAIYGEVENADFITAGNDLSNRHAFNLLAADFDRRAAEASGLIYVEEDKSENSFGIYRIYTSNLISGESSDTATILAGYYGIDSLTPPKITIFEADQAIRLEWNNEVSSRSQEKYTGYFIERSEDGKDYYRLTEEPFVNVNTALTNNRDYTSYIDSVDNGIQYQYRVIGIDAFADMSDPSEVVTAVGRDITPPSNAQLISAEETEDKDIALKWDWINTGEDEDDLSGFDIYRAALEDGQYVKINNQLLSANIRSFIDKNPDANSLNYYYIQAVDNDGNTSKSIALLGYLKDDVPPAPPVALVGEIDENGKVLIEWTPPADLDLQGYELFFTNDLSIGFIKKSGPIVSEKFYVDSITLKTLTEEVYYQVVAVDYNFNRSSVSEILTIKRPDIVPPAASIFSDYYVSEEGIQFTWIKSTSDDVVAVVLQRRSDTEDWIEISDFDTEKNTYQDKNVEEGVKYEYNLITMDDDGNTATPQNTLVLEAKKSFYLKDVENITLDRQDKKVVLNWQYENASQYQFIIYRKYENGDLLTFKKLDGQESISLTYTEGQSYEFAIKAKADDGRASKISKTVKL